MKFFIIYIGGVCACEKVPLCVCDCVRACARWGLYTCLNCCVSVYVCVWQIETKRDGDV